MDPILPLEEHVGNLRCYTLDFIAAFAALPRTRNRSIAGVKEPRRSSGSLVPPSNVTHLIIFDANLSASAFESDLQGGAPLQVFKLVLWSYASHFDEKGFEKVLRTNASDSLE